MNQYQFDQIIRKMERRFGKIQKGSEDAYMPFFLSIEGNMLIVHRGNPEANGRRAREALMLALHKIDGYLTHEEKDVSSFENRENKMLLDAILYAVDPFASEEGKKLIGKVDREDPEFLEGVFKTPVLCIMRLIESIDFWTKQMGPDGYFNYIKDGIGNRYRIR